MKTCAMLFIGLVLVMYLLPVKASAEEGDFNKGKTLYLKYCETCHGPEGKGDGYLLFNSPVADLTSSEIQLKSDKALWKSIHMGRPNTSMGMWRFVLTDEEIHDVLGYVRSLAELRSR